LHEFALPLKNPVLVFSLILFIILLSPIILRKLNIPGIIGLIISGVVIGPHGLGILEKNSAVELFSTIGLLYIMFIAGLELDMQDFKANRNSSLLFGFFTFIIPLSVGYPVCYYLLHFSFEASLLTASMFATHTLVAYPIVSKFGITKNRAVAAAVGGTVLTDTAVLIILAVVMGKAEGTLNQEFWIKLIASLSIFTAIMFLVIPRIAKWFFRALESEKHSHYIFVLSVVFFSAFLAEVAGVEPIIGAFAAGLALNRLIPHTSALMNRIEFMGNSLFIPFFLISVGMLVDISVITKGPGAWIVAGTLTAVAIFGKWLAALVTQLSFKFSRAQRQLIFGLSSAHAAATLAVILVGFNAGILNENVLNGTIILILVTCVLASFVTEKAAKKIVLESGDEDKDVISMAKIGNEHILLPISQIDRLEKLLELSILLKDKKSANPVSILSVVSNNDEAEINIVKARNKLENFVKQASATETPVNIITTIDHNASSGIVRISREIIADIIVLGWHSKGGFIDKLLGEKLDNILNNTDKMIFVCQLNEPLVSHKRIVVAVPPLAEFENGFEHWIAKISKISGELSIPVHLFANDATLKSVAKYLKKAKSNMNPVHHDFEDWQDFLVISREIKNDDLFVIISARKGSASYMGLLEQLPIKLEKHFPENNKIIIFPQQYQQESLNENYEDINAETLQKGIETVQKIGRGIGNIFKKDED
jgi:Kef-type K+ transport system membrane component KefB